jgi:[protein-PII] uridylyltransferase
MRLNVDEGAQLEFLVRHHLLLAHTAFRRDIEDEKLVIDFAQSVGSIGNLKMLYLLTYADTRAVGPEVWNNWKGSLLATLYLRALELLESREKGEFRREDRRSKVRRIQVRLRRRLTRKHPAETIGQFLESMPERYFLATPEDDMPFHFEIMERLGDQVYVSRVRHFPQEEYSEMVICAKDAPGVFARITGVFAAMGLDILSARITTRKDGLILDVFRISHSGRAEIVMAPEKWSRLGATLEKALTGAVDVARLVEESARPSLFQKKTLKVPTAVQIDNESSEDFTIVEVYTQDRIGVLFAITYGLYQLGISIHLAKISTNVDQVADIFYVTDDQGVKLVDPERLEKVRQALYQSLVSRDEERTAQSPH